MESLRIHESVGTEFEMKFEKESKNQVRDGVWKGVQDGVRDEVWDGVQERV